jgi:hypothetical protein
MYAITLFSAGFSGLFRRIVDVEVLQRAIRLNRRDGGFGWKTF